MRFANFIVSAAAAVVLLPASAFSAGTAEPLPQLKWSFQGIFGTFDRAQLKRGSQVFFEVCASCHGLDMVYYRNLVEMGLDEDVVKELASGYEVEDGPDDEGEMFMRPARLSDHIVNPFANEKAARSANGGAFPPDLSVITKARKDGVNYLYALMTGYLDEAPEGFELTEGTHYNKYFPGHQVFMPAPLMDESVEYEDGTEATLDQHARDIATFLAWSANPELEERKSLGIKVMLYLLVLTAMFYALKKRIWKRICLDEETHGRFSDRVDEEIRNSRA